jgi:hypothetical protein
VRRYLAEGDAWLHPRSGRPLTSSLQTPRVVEGEIVAIRKGHVHLEAPARAHVIRHVSAGRARRPRLPRVKDEEEDEIGRGDQLTPVALSVSSAVGREDDAWGIVSRHADPITAARPPTSVVQRG